MIIAYIQQTMENSKVIALAVIFAVVAVRLIQKQRAKNFPAGTNQKDTLVKTGTKITNIPDDYEPYSGK